MMSKCIKCSEEQRYDDARTLPSSQGPYLQLSEGPYYQTAQVRTACTECRRRCGRLPCNSVPGQSQGPHLQCTEQPCYHDTHVRTTCTECRRRHGRLPCNSVPGQSQGPHLQCTDEHSIQHLTTSCVNSAWCRNRAMSLAVTDDVVNLQYHATMCYAVYVITCCHYICVRAA